MAIIYIRVLLIYCELIAFILCKTNLNEYKKYKEFLNYGDTNLTKLKNEVYENNVSKTKVEILGEIFKSHIDEIKLNDKLDVIFLIDSSSSVGANNFDNEIKFVKKLLSDIPVDYNHTRIAIVTYSSDRNIVKNIDEITSPNEENNKCLLLNEELKKVKFSGGGTYTLGAFEKAQEIFDKSRNESKKILFLITDGYSNGGDPVPIANALKKNDVLIFTIGIKNGNFKELFDLSSTPGEFYSYLLDSFHEFENLARRALHVDFKRGDYIPLSSTKLCDKLCVGGDCCDSNAVCTCGTSTGHYTCLCKPGYYGSGLKNSCTPCPRGTYADGSNLCIPCPDIHHITIAPAIGKNSCKCKPGYQSAGIERCEVIKCSRLSPPDHGYFVKKRQCSNVLNSACGVRCLVGYTLTGSSIRLCQSNASWSGYNPSCHIKTCERPKTPQFGSVTCKHDDLDLVYESEENLPVDTICTFTCGKGRTLIGSIERTCLPLAQWDGLKTSCKQLKCNKLSKIPYGKVEPKSCTIGKQPYGKKCNITCQDGFEISGSNILECTGQHWNDMKEISRCIDKVPPEITCPNNMITNSSLGKSYGQVNWKKPIPKDNTNLQMVMWTEPAIANIKNYKFQIGVTNVTYFARDAFNNTANCTFSVTVIDNEPPTIEDCTDPPTFLISNRDGIDITWDVPNIFDNSQMFTVEVSHGFGHFDVGTTQVTYKAIDSAMNINECVLNITVEEQMCEDLPDPVFGNSKCITASGLKQCVITCQEGYALPINIPMDTYDIDNGTKFICNISDPIWYNLEGQIFPDCTVTLQPEEILQEGTITVNVTNTTDVCEDTNKLNQLENDIKNDIVNDIVSSCKEMDCKLNATANCEDDVKKEAEEDLTNVIKKRDTTSTDKKKNRKKDQKLARVQFQLRVKSKLNVTVNGDKIRTSLSNNNKYKIKLNNIQLICRDGYMQRKSKCAQCPKGTFHNLTSNACQNCPFGQYNDLVAQIQCKSCPFYHSTRKTKSKNLKNCVRECLPGTYARNKTMKNKAAKGTSITRPTLMPYCRSCAIGYYQSNYNQLHCIKCPKGLTTSDRNSKSVNDCIPTLETMCNNETSKLCNFGKCKIINNFEYKCNCEQGYLGSHCEHKINPCNSNPCLNGGACNHVNHTFSCTCSEGFTGIYCQETQDTCDKCFNKGQCAETSDGDNICFCPKGYYGKYCEEKMLRCNRNVCENNAKCIEDFSTFKCICQSGFIGRRCNLLPCDYAPCSGNKSCTNMNILDANRKSYRCECPVGYKGNNCNEKIKYCDSSPCLNNGTCIEDVTEYKCKCFKPYNGTNCEQELFGNYTLHFAKLSATNYVKMRGPSNDLKQFTICSWIQTSDKFNYGTIFSYATSNYDNALTITDYTGLVLYVNNRHIVTNVNLNDGEWHFFCINWENFNGNFKIFVDGKFVKNGNNFAKGEIIKGDGIVIIGQDQDILGGEFSQSESYIGKISHLDVWDFILSENQIKRSMESCKENAYGNLYSWPEFKYNIHGDIEVENCTFCQLCNKPGFLKNGRIKVLNNTAYYQCDDGYFLNSNIYKNGRKCTKSSKWEGRNNPYCKPLYCGHPGYFHSGYIIGHNYYYSNRITYKCYENYNLTGNSTRYCSKFGTWLPDKPPLCSGNECAVINVPNSVILILPDIKYEEYIDESSYFEPESQLKIKCLENYVLSGHNILTCLENGTWNYEPPKCLLPQPEHIPIPKQTPVAKNSSKQLPVQRPNAVPIQKPIPTPKSTTKPILVTEPIPTLKPMPVQKPTPVIPLPKPTPVIPLPKPTPVMPLPKPIPAVPLPNSTPIITVSKSTPKSEPVPELMPAPESVPIPKPTPKPDSISKLKPTSIQKPIPIPETSPCQINLMPSAPDNGYIDQESIEYFKNNDTDTVIYKCRSGYKLEGNGTTSCSGNKSWTIPKITCKAIECRNPPKYKFMEIAERNTSSHYYSGNMVIYHCMEGYKLIGRDSSIRCMANGKWSRFFGKCYKITCNEPKVSDDTEVIGNSYLFDDTVTIKCPSKKEYVLKCDALAQWSGEKDETC